MVNKPEGCKTCPLYGDGKGFVPGHYPGGARVLVVGQAPGADEEKKGEPFVGKTGEAMERQFLPLAGLGLAEVARDNAVRCRWVEPGKKVKGNKLPSGKTLTEAIRCCAQYDPDLDELGIELVVAQGAIALQKYGPGLKQYEWRGHLLPEGVA